jgi:plastocyanin
MNKIIIAVIVLAVIGVGTYYLVFNKSSDGTPTYSPATQTSTTPTPKNIATETFVNINNFAFIPSSLNIRKGTKVTWVNNDSVPHTITSDSGNLLQSPTLSPGQSFSFTFTTAGNYNYHCSIHTSMESAVIVTN